EVGGEGAIEGGDDLVRGAGLGGGVEGGQQLAGLFTDQVDRALVEGGEIVAAWPEAGVDADRLAGAGQRARVDLGEYQGLGAVTRADHECAFRLAATRGRDEGDQGGEGEHPEPAAGSMPGRGRTPRRRSGTRDCERFWHG